MEPLDYIDEDEGLVNESFSDVIYLQIPTAYRGERLDKTLAKLLPDYSRSRIQQWLERGLVLSSGMTLTPKTAVLGGESLVLQIPEDPQNSAFKPENIPLDIVFEDECVVVINKPAGLVVHPAAGNWTGTLLNGLLFKFPECEFVPRAGIVHRLDKDTSGLLVVAKTLQAQTNLVRQLQDRTVNRKYLALVWGEFPAQKVIRGQMGRDPRDRLKMAVLNSSGKEAVTQVTRLSTVEYGGSQISLVVCKLETGRTHQIRVHLESIGFPLLNDSVYKKRVPTKANEHIKQAWSGGNFLPGQALHAAVLGFNHPLTMERVNFSAIPSNEFCQLMNMVGISQGVLNELLEFKDVH